MIKPSIYLGKRSMSIVGWLLLLVVNLLFVCKYFSRVGFSPLWSCVGYTIGVIFVIVLWYRVVQARLSDRVVKGMFWLLLACMTLGIGFALWKVDPMAVRVDRWSATTYFLDALFQGIYPYGVHTHVSETNFPSPFPVWHYLNIPFWLLGDVGLGLIVMLWLTLAVIYLHTHNIRVVFTFLLLLALSPAYWWEVLVRSDGLSNSLLVFVVILWLDDVMIVHRNDVGEKWVVVAVVAGCIACTRLSAIIPIAIYLFGKYIRSGKRVWLFFPMIVASVFLFFFLPYIFWDVDSWVFFSRNPFMSQSAPGNRYILLVMVLIAIILSIRIRSFHRLMGAIGIFMFAFMCISLIGSMSTYEGDITLLDLPCDISYLTLCFPYLMLYVSSGETLHV